MPCDTIREIGVDLKNVGDASILLRALETAGYSGVRVEGQSIYGITPAGQRFEISEGQVKISGSRYGDLEGQATEISGEISRAYAAEVFQEIGQQYGFAVTQDAENPLHLTLQRRAF